MDIVHPSMDQLLPKVDSKYTLVVLAAKRARQILAGSPVKSVLQSHKDVTNALEEVAEDMEDILKHFNMLNEQLLEKMNKEKAEDIMKCIPMKMEQFYEKFDKNCMDMPIFKYYDPFQLFQRISCASNEDIVLIKEKLVDRVDKNAKKIEPEMKNIKQLKQIIDDYLKGKEPSIKYVMLKEFAESLEYILSKYKTIFLPKKQEIAETTVLPGIE